VRRRRIRTQAFGKSSKPGGAGRGDKTPENGGNALRGGTFYAMSAPNWSRRTLIRAGHIILLGRRSCSAP
jgi:hypothetical protein